MSSFPINDLEEEYLSINDEDDDKMLNLKQAIKNLNPIDKNIILLYIHTASYRKAAELLGISASTLLLKINKIKAGLKCL